MEKFRIIVMLNEGLGFIYQEIYLRNCNWKGTN